MKRLRRWFPRQFFIPLSFVVLMGCHTTPPVAPVHAPAADELLKSMQEARPNLKTLRAEGRADYNHKGRRVKFHASMLVSYPDHFFVEVGGFGFSASQVSANAKKIRVYTPAKTLAYEGDAQNGLRNLFGLQIGISEWVKILLLQIPEDGGQIDSYQPSGSNSILKLRYDKDLLWLNIVQSTSWTRSLEYPLRDHLKVFFEKPMPTPAGSYPSTIRVVGPHSSLDLSFEKVEANPNLQDNYFDINIPKGVPVRSLDTAENVLGE